MLVATEWPGLGILLRSREPALSGAGVAGSGQGRAWIWILELRVEIVLLRVETTKHKVLLCRDVVKHPNAASAACLLSYCGSKVSSKQAQFSKASLQQQPNGVKLCFWVFGMRIMEGSDKASKQQYAWIGFALFSLARKIC